MIYIFPVFYKHLLIFTKNFLLFFYFFFPKLLYGYREIAE